VRLFVDPGAPELHNLRWELLRDPRDASNLFTGEQILFLRYLGSLDCRPVRLRPQSELRALVVIANPADITRYQPGGRQFTPVDVTGELARAQAGLGSIALSSLVSEGSATLLRGGFDILHLVCHGALWAAAGAGLFGAYRGRRLDGSLAVRFGERYLPVKRCAMPNPRKAAEANQPAKAQRVRRRGSDWNKNFDLKKAPKVWQAAQGSGYRTGEAL
jgi:hypothetical protein